VPPLITRDDAETIAFLKNLLDGEIKGVDEVTGVILKEVDDERWIAGIAEGKSASIKFSHPGLARHFAGITISTGPLEVILDEVCFSDPDATLERYRNLPIGSELQVNWRPMVAPRVNLVHRRNLGSEADQ
jgi:hypothetical protein